MGMYATVCRNAEFGDCSLNGVSKRFNKLLVVNVDGPFGREEDEECAVLLEQHVRGCLRIVPAVKDGNGKWIKDPRWAMFGGNYASCSDSRFTELCEQLLGHRFYGAVAIHDRYESQKQMEELSRD